MKTLLTILFPMLSTGFAIAQVTFEPVPPPMPLPQITYDFVKVNGSSAAFADVNGDGYLDVLITGDIESTSSVRTTVGLYINNGRGSYYQVQDVPFDEVTGGSVDFADVDVDGDLDVLITGSFNATNTRAKLYANDGNGNFTVLADESVFMPVGASDADFADIDGDGDQDLVITGYNNQTGTARLYQNDGSGNFTFIDGTPFTPLANGTVNFEDVDGDNDKDLLITGIHVINSNTRETTTELYLNDGAGNFTVATNLSIAKVHRSTANFADLDGDNDLDLFITGDTTYTGNDGQFSALYINDGSGVFTEASGNSFTNIEQGAVDIADVDHDGDIDILMAGYKGYNKGGNVAELYTNDGSGSFTMTDATTFPRVIRGSVSFADINGDSSPDVLVTGNMGGRNVASLYYSHGNGTFAVVPRSQVIEVGNNQQPYAAAAFADVDNDGDPDLIVSGQTDSITATILYYNWQGNFHPDWDVTERPVSELPSLSSSALDFADVDNDGDQDILLAGYGKLPGGSSYNRYTVLYKYDLDAKIYVEADKTTFTGVTNATVRFADVDNDGDQDVLIMGSPGSNTYSTELYLNDGTGNYTLTSNPFTNMSRGDAAFADVNGDGYADLFLTGYNAGRQAELYLNDGSGGFTLSDDQTFEKVYNSSVAFADVDGDNDMDLFISGDGDGSYNTVGSLYTNDGTGSFTLQAGSSFKGVKYSAMAFSDLDADGDPDLILTGFHYPGPNTIGIQILEAYTNDGSGNFSVVSDSPFWGFTGVQYGDLAVADINNDNYDDVLLVGWSHSGRTSALFKNTACEGCEPDPCAGITCPEGEVCYLGTCFRECDPADSAECFSLGPNLVADAGSSVVLEAGPDFDVYLWSTGDTTRTIVVDASGTYWVTGYNVAGSFFGTDTVNVLVRAAPDGSCPDGYTNRDGYCFPPGDPCEGVTCPEGKVCWEGTCYDPCVSEDPCDPDDLCYAGACYTETLCDIIICAEGQYCYEGSCYDTCANDTQVYLGPNLIGPSDAYLGLDAGADYGYYEWSTGDTTATVIINASGQYWVIAIDTVSNAVCTDTVKILISANQLGECPEGLVEANGYCYKPDDHCEGVTCPEGEACYGGGCYPVEVCSGDNPDSECYVEAPCDNVVCPEGYECDEGECVPLKHKGFIGSPGSSIRLNAIQYFTLIYWSTGETTSSITVNASGQYTYDAVSFQFPIGGSPGSTFSYQDTINVLIQADPFYGCPDGQVEQDGYCFLPDDPCEGVTCPDGYVCFEGTCYPECNADSTYADGFCYKGIHFKYPDCEDVTCSSYKDCIDGRCYQWCVLPSDCPEGTTCTDEFVCMPEEIACDYIDCEDGYQCVFGNCLRLNILDNGAYNLTGVLFIDENPGGRMTENGPIGNTTIYLLSEDGTEINGIVTTDADGNYFFENLPPGTYTIFVDHMPYKIKGDGKVVLKPGIKFTTLDIVSDGTEFELRLSYITGLDKQFKGFSFYPNPTHGKIILSSSVDIGKVEVRITDVTGQLLHKNTVNIMKSREIFIANLNQRPSGLVIVGMYKDGQLIYESAVVLKPE